MRKSIVIVYYVEETEEKGLIRLTAFNIVHNVHPRSFTLHGKQVNANETGLFILSEPCIISSRLPSDSLTDRWKLPNKRIQIFK